MSREDELKKLNTLHNRRDVIIEKYKLKKFHAKTLAPFLAGITPTIVTLGKYFFKNEGRRAAIKPEVDKYALEEAHKIDVKYGYDHPLFLDAKFIPIDSTNVEAYLYNHYHRIRYSESISDLSMKYVRDYTNGDFNYVSETMKAMYDSVHYSFLDAIKDMLPVSLGSIAVVGMYYAHTLLKSKHELDKINKEVAKLEDKLFWDR